MAKDFSVTINQTGDKLILTDTTVWASEPETRASKAIISAAFIYNQGESFSQLLLSEGSQNTVISTNPASFSYDVGADSYCKAKLIYADLNILQGSGFGRVLFLSATNQYFVTTESGNQQVTYDQLIAREDIADSYKVEKDIPFSSYLEKKLDSIWKRYEQNGLPHEGKDFKNFYTGYALLLGAIASARQAAFFEFDRKIDIANKLVSKWL